MRYLVDKMPNAPVNCPFYGIGGQCDYEKFSKCEYFTPYGDTGDEYDCFAFRTLTEALKIQLNQLTQR